MRAVPQESEEQKSNRARQTRFGGFCEDPDTPFVLGTKLFVLVACAPVAIAAAAIDGDEKGVARDQGPEAPPNARQLPDRPRHPVAKLVKAYEAFSCSLADIMVVMTAQMGWEPMWL